MIKTNGAKSKTRREINYVILKVSPIAFLFSIFIFLAYYAKRFF